MIYYMIKDDKAQFSIKGELFTIREVQKLEEEYKKHKTFYNMYRCMDIIHHSKMVIASRKNTYKMFGARFLIDENKYEETSEYIFN